jgi:hypothetical protein
MNINRWVRANPTTTVIQDLGKKSIQTNRDSADVLRHIIKNVSSRLVGTIQSPVDVRNTEGQGRHYGCTNRRGGDVCYSVAAVRD